MRFADPDMLKWLLLILPLMGLVFVRALFYRARARSLFASGRMLGRINAATGTSPVAGAVLSVAAVTLILLSMARPQWGFMWEDMNPRKADVLFVLDVSRSMLSEDAKPSRLGLSKSAIQAVIGGMSGEKAGLMAFAGEAFLMSPFTPNYRVFSIILDHAGPENVPTGGTSIGSALDEAAKVFENSSGEVKALVIFTDGGDTAARAEKAAGKLKKMGIRSYVIGVGQKEDVPIPVTDKSGKIAYVKDEDGKPVRTAIDDAELKRVAGLLDGRYYSLCDGEKSFLKDIRGQISRKLSGKKETGEMYKVYIERFPLALMAALAAVLLGIFRGGKK